MRNTYSGETVRAATGHSADAMRDQFDTHREVGALCS